jgi:adenosylhomocysteine nucleosidase
MSKRIGIMGAMPEEIDGLLQLIDHPVVHTIGMRNYYTGTINNHAVVVVFSRWGKVAAATTVSTLILKFNVTQILFTGVAGAISHKLNVGDVVVADRLFMHDMDARPLLPKFEIPLLGLSHFQTPEWEREMAVEAVSKLIDDETLHGLFTNDQLALFGITKPQLYCGDIASGDQFFSSHAQKEELKDLLPSVLCVEMEGAAVAQVCHENDIPCTIIRTISDCADDSSHIDFKRFIDEIGSRYSVEIIKYMLGVN